MINVNITDAGNTYNYALKKILELGYDVSVTVESNFFYCAKKDGKTFLEENPVKLLGLLTIIEKFGQDCNKRNDIVHHYSLKLE